MEVIFGVQASDRVLKVQIPDDDVAALKDRLNALFASDGDRILWVTDTGGAELAIPADKLAFVEFGNDKTSRTVGFSSAV